MHVCLAQLKQKGIELSRKYLDFSTGNNYLDDSLENYLIYGYEPGGFLTSVLAGDVFLAAGRADAWNKQNLADIAKTLYVHMPIASIGSYQAVADWCANKDNRRSKYAEKKEKQLVMRILKGEYRESDPQTVPF